MKTFIIKGFAAFLLIFLFAGSGSTQTLDIIDSVSPTTATPGDTDVEVIINLDTSQSMPPIPPSAVSISSVTIGTVAARSNTRTSDYVIAAVFDFPADTSTGVFDLAIVFAGPQGDITFTETGVFTIGSTGSTGSLTVTISPTGAVSDGAKWNVDSGSWQNSGATVSDLTEGSHTVSFSSLTGWTSPSDQSVTISADQTASTTGTYTESTSSLTYPIVDTGQQDCSSDRATITCPTSGEAFYGQDAQYQGYQFSFNDNGDGTVSDLVTGLMWQQTADADGDGDIDADDKYTYTAAQTYCENLSLAGYTDWRLPHIKESYSLIDFRGVDCSAYNGTDTSALTPFIDNTVFDYNWGDLDADERLIDSQYASDTQYVDTSANNGNGTLFGVNFADGRIKGYGMVVGGTEKTFFCMCVRENTSYGVNSFVDNSDGTITDNATGLMWAQDDSGSALNWEEALAWVQTQNSANYLGYGDWRMPNIKELQSIVDYTRSPETTSSAAIDPVFNATSITNEGGETDYPYYWSGTTHTSYPSSVATANYISFGRALGYGNEDWHDVHGAGAQRSDPKSGDPAEYPTGHGPQGDAIRIYNYVRLVRDADTTSPVETGTLTVNISPQGAIDAGAKWKADSGSWQDSGTTVSDLSAGSHAVSFSTVTGWTAPGSQAVTITADSIKTLTVTYTEAGTEQTVGLFIHDTEKAFEGYTLFAPMQSKTTYLMDNEGNFVHSWESDYTPGLSAYLLENGNLLRTAGTMNMTFKAGGSGGKVQEIDPDGNVVWEFEHSGDQYLLHHDIELLPSGNILMIAWEYKSADVATAAGRNPNLLKEGELWPDKIIEVDPGTGKIVWEWHVWDHIIQEYDDSKPNHGTVSDHPELIDLNYVASGPGAGGADWTHINSVDYHDEFDQIIVSVHSFSEIWIIDHSTTTEQAAGHTGGKYGKGGDLLYRWGNPQAYGAGTSNDQKLFSQHDATWIESGYPGEGNILIFNNGQKRSDGDYSSVDEIMPPVDAQGNYSLSTGAAYGPSDMTWTYSSPSNFYSQNISGAQRLSNGNTLICNGANGIFFEVTADKEVVWEYVNPVAGDGIIEQGEPIPEMNGEKTNQVFRVYRYAPNYAGLPGDIAPDVKGDMNGDGSVTLADLVITLRICAGDNISPIADASEADVNGDGSIGLAEAIYILWKITDVM